MKEEFLKYHGGRQELESVAGDALISLKRVTKSYRTPAGSFEALKAIDLEVGAGESLAIVGKSGSGKSTLLNMLSGIDRPTAGEVVIGGTAVHELNGAQLAAWRGSTVGVVFQFFQLLPTLTMAENVMLPMDFLNSYPLRQRKERAMMLLERVGIPEQADKLPATLSGGQQQRAAIARALANDPPMIVADEPTGNLDSETAQAILDLFSELINEGKSLVMVTHERDISQLIGRTVTLADGRIVNGAYRTEETLEVAHA
jgi:putative ABC transport system ATP-binding protein